MMWKKNPLPPERKKNFFVPLVSLWFIFLLSACEAHPYERNNAANDMTHYGNYGGAVQAYQVSQVLNPDEPQAYYNAAVALSEIEELEAAEASLKQALETVDETLIKEAYYNLGNVYFKMELYFEAIEAYQEVLLRNPDDSDARYNMELALLNAKLPTPTAIEQKTEPDEGDTDPTTPTNQPNSLTGPTPTPPRVDDEPDLTATPEAGTGELGSNTPSTLVPQMQGELSMEEALELLEDVQQDTQALSEYLNNPAPVGDPEQNDW